nr:AlNc14C23G2353 [Albugo laibachii Nc14]|eukprot:CCA16596.1 AlNc14C23G2353 [Albugo laibachii Nc14]
MQDSFPGIWNLWYSISDKRRSMQLYQLTFKLVMTHRDPIKGISGVFLVTIQQRGTYRILTQHCYAARSRLVSLRQLHFRAGEKAHNVIGEDTLTYTSNLYTHNTMHSFANFPSTHHSYV